MTAIQLAIDWDQFEEDDPETVDSPEEQRAVFKAVLEWLREKNIPSRTIDSILTKYYGGLDRSKVGLVLGCTRERVRQIEEDALFKLGKERTVRELNPDACWFPKQRGRPEEKRTESTLARRPSPETTTTNSAEVRSGID